MKKRKENPLYSRSSGISEELFYYPSGKVRERLLYKNNALNEITIFYENGNPCAKFFFDACERQRLRVLYYPNGELEEIAEQDNGENNGAFILFLRDGNLQMYANYDCGIKEGREMFFHNGVRIDFSNFIANGEFPNMEIKERKISLIREYSNGKLNGLAIERFSSGKKKNEVMYENGKKLWEESYRENGSIKSRCEYVDGRIECIKDFRIDGTISAETFYSASRGCYIERRFDKSGEVASETHYLNNLKHGMQLLYKNGAIIGRNAFSNGEEVKTKR